MSDDEATEIRGQFDSMFEQADRDIGRFNLGIFGKPGVGKTTLVNTIFGKEVAPTGVGRPITERYEFHDGDHLGVIDTRGLDIGRDVKAFIKDLEGYVRTTRKKAPGEEIHVAWYCVMAASNRFEDTEEEFIRALHRLGNPVLVVLTQVPRKDGKYEPTALKLADHIGSRKLPLSGPVHLINAQKNAFHGTPQHGLDELLDETFRVAPDGVQTALAAAQKISVRRKRAAANKVILAAAGAAAGIGAVPIPFPDAAVLIPIQLGMMSRIAIIYNVPFDRASAAAVAATVGARTFGTNLVLDLLALVPGFGTVTVGAIEASVASAITLAMGKAWMVICAQISKGELQFATGALDSDAIREAFMKQFRSNIGRGNKEAELEE